VFGELEAAVEHFRWIAKKILHAGRRLPDQTGLLTAAKRRDLRRSIYQR